MKRNKYHALILNDNDNVAVITNSNGIKAGMPVYAKGSTTEKTVNAVSDIPFTHKIALSHIKKGESIIKYGYAVGAALTDISAGQLVDHYNMAGKRSLTDISILKNPEEEIK